MGAAQDGTTTMDEQVTPKKKRFGINKNLVMLKVTLFFMYGATSSLMPYLTIHMQSIGLTIEEIALIYLALPFTTFLAPPVTGFLVDKFGKYKPVVIISFILTAGIHHSLLLIPHQETPGVVPHGYILRHPNESAVEVWWSPCPSRECPDESELDIVLDLCVDHCVLKHTNHEQMENIDPGDEDDLKFHLGKKGKNHTKHREISLTVIMHDDLGQPIEQIGIEINADMDDESVTDIRKRFGEDLLLESGINITELEENDLRCGGLVNITDTPTYTRLNQQAEDCMLQKCSFRRGGPAVCPPNYNESDDKIFWIYFVVRFVGSIMMTAGVTIMDPIALTMIEKYGGDFGREKLFSSLGMALFSPITGAFIDYNSKRLGYTDYSAAFYAYDILLIIACISVFLMPLGTKLPADNIFRDLMNIFKIPSVLVFIFFLFILGNLWGFIESFLFFYLKDLGAPNYLLGITVTVGTVSSMPFLYGAEKITKKIGHVNVIIIAFFAHSARLMGYSFIQSAWWCFPFEALESLSVHLMWVAAATYCAILAPKNLLATLIGVLAMAHFSIGRGSGSFIGGHILGKVGTREAFRVMGLVAVTSGTIYSLLHYLWLRKRTTDKDEETTLESGETEKLKEEPKFKDQSTMVSFERLSLMIEYNQIGSLTSLGRRGEIGTGRSRSDSIRRGSYTIGMSNKPSQGSASKVDLLKSALEVNHSRNSNPQLKNSTVYLNKQSNSSGKIFKDSRASSTPKLQQRSTSLSPVVDKLEESLIPKEVDELMYDKAKTDQNGEKPEENKTEK